MTRFRADVWREQVVEVEFDVDDPSQDLAAVAVEAVDGWSGAETISTVVQELREVREETT